MHLIAQNRFRFDFPVALQRSHLKDIWHLDKAHWLTLCGVSIGEVFCKTPKLVWFSIHRFGQTREVIITQTEEITLVTTKRFILKFEIEPTLESHHFLQVSLFSDIKKLRYLWALIQVVFYLTVWEDMLYYGNHTDH